MKEQPRTQLKGVILLLLTALIWGSSFVAQSVGMESVECFTYSGIRTLLGAIFLLPFVLVQDHRKRKNTDAAAIAAERKKSRNTIRCGFILGLIFSVAQNLQQYAFNDSTAGKIAFITALYMFFVPLLGLFLKKRISILTWICILFGFIGLYFLCIQPGNFTNINRGDFFAFLCAIAFAVHILAIERFAADTDGVKLSCTQFAVAGTISIVIMFLFETPHLSTIRAAAVPMLYSGIMSCGIAYTFQIIGQKYTEATIASMLMCLESVFAVLTSALLLHEWLTTRELIGCTIMFAAIIGSQLAESLAAKKDTDKTA